LRGPPLRSLLNHKGTRLYPGSPGFSKRGKGARGGRGSPETGPSTMLPVESLSFDPEALDGWVERGPP